MCCYRTPDEGLSCAVGCLIPDNEYRPKMESQSALAIQPEVKSLVPLSGALLENMQEAHDDWHVGTTFDENCLEQFRVIAETYNLDPSVLDERNENV